MGHPKMNQKRNVGVNEGGGGGNDCCLKAAGVSTQTFCLFFYFCHPLPISGLRRSSYFRFKASNEPNFGISLFGQGIYHL